MSLWESAVAPLKPKRSATDLERRAIAEVCDMATEFARLPIAEKPNYLDAIRQTTSPRQRSLAVAFTPVESSAWRPLMTMLEELIRQEPGFQTAHGWFDEATIRDNGGRLADDPKGKIIQFPDPSGNYRAPADRNPIMGRFRAANVTPIRREVEWWERAEQEAVPF